MKMNNHTVKSIKKSSVKKFPIAIIGMGVRFPGDIRGADSLWQALKEGRDCITDIPSDRWNIEKYYDPDPNKSGKIKTKKGGFISGMKEFDAEFFNIYPNVADKMDTRQRHLLEVVYESLEDANITIDQINATKTAVITGIFLGDEGKKYAGDDIDHINAHSLMGSSDVTVPARIAYQFNLKGPVLSVDTACSSSLVAVQIACNNIWIGDADMAIAGGVNIMSSHEHFVGLSKGGFLSPDGYCKSFDAAGNGYVRGEGAGVVILKPLDQAEKDGDNIYAVIKNAVVNFDGYTEDGMTVPNEFAQQQMLEEVYSGASINPKDVDFIEAHGTGTVVGDPKECAAFGNVFAKDRDPQNPLIIGSIKSNIGHTEAVAGIAGLTKLALCIKNKQIPQNLHFNTPNPKIKFDEWKLKVPTKLTKWPGKKDRKAIAGVNSFGAGGTNSHIVLEEYVSNSKSEQKSKSEDSNDNFPYIFSLSAKSKNSLKKLAEKYLNFTRDGKNNLIDICYSVINNRSNFEEKLIIICNSKEDLIKKLSLYISDTRNQQIITGKTKKNEKLKIAFICSGQGPQWYAMGRQLLEKSKIFSEIITKIDKIFNKISGYSLLTEMKKNKEDSRVSETRIAQPAIMAVQIGLIEIWKYLGINPDGIVGHSIGEVAAAYGAGSLTLEQAVDVIYNRSKEQDKASGKGKMLAIGLPLSKSIQIIQKYQRKVSIAAVNGPEATVLSGDAEPLEIIAKELEEKDIFSRFLKINVPFHSHYMDMTRDDMIESLKDLKPQKSAISLYSTVTGLQESGLHLTNEYWYKNVRDTVYFISAIEKMIADGFNYFIEIAPHPILGAGVNDMLSLAKKDGYIISSLSRNIKSFEANIDYEINDILSAAAKVHVATNRTQFLNLLVDKNQNPTSIKLPTYSWDHKEYWYESEDHKESRLKKRIHPFIKTVIESSLDKNLKIIDLDLSPKKEIFLADHKIGGVMVLPATAHAEIAIAVGKKFYGDKFSHIENLEFKKALFLSDKEEQVEAKIEINLESGLYQIFSKKGDSQNWQSNSSGKISCDSTANDANNYDKLKDLKNRIDKKISVDEFYSKLKSKGLNYGYHFRLIKEMWQNDDGEILARVELSQEDEYIADQYNIIPNLSDSCLHASLFAGGDNIYLPQSFGKFTKYKDQQSTLWSYVKLHSIDSKNIVSDVVTYDSDSQIVSITKNINKSCLDIQEDNADRGLYKYQWFESHVKTKIASADVTKNNKINIAILSDEGLSTPLSKELSEAGYNIITIDKGTSFQNEFSNHYRINPTSKDNFIELFLSLKNKNIKLSKIINLWSVDSIIDDTSDSKAFQIESQNLFLSNLYLSQEILKIENQEIYIYQITKNADQVDKEKDKNINFLQGSLYGMGRVFMNEHPDHQVRMIDLGCQKLEDNVSHLIKEINKEEKVPYETEIAIRDYGRFARKLVAIEQKMDTNQELSFKNDATYLISGGASGLGLTLAEWMFERGARNFALVSRSGPKYERDNKIILKLQNLGANINWQDVKGDVSKEEDINRVISYIKNNMPPLRGVIHSAGILDDSSYPNMTKERFFKVYDPKALGAWNLHRATLDTELDLFLLISSVSSFIGIGGQSNYSSANSFLNYLSIYRNSNGLACHSACFGLIGGDYAGMTKDSKKNVDSIYRALGTVVINRSDIDLKLEELLNSNFDYLMISSMKWSNFVKTYKSVKDRFMFSAVIKKDSFSKSNNLDGILQKIIASDDIDWKVEKVSELLANSVADILGVSGEDISLNNSITTIGLDSLMLNQFRSWIQLNIEINLFLMRLAKGPSLTELATEIISMLKKDSDNVGLDKSGIDGDDDIVVSSDKWFVRRRKEDDNVKIKIFCLHPVGAGASIFSHFIFNPPKNTEIIALQMPGRENRLDEGYYYSNVDKLVEDLSKQIIPEIDGPSIFWGHSWGGVTLYEVIKYMRRNNITEYQNIKKLIVTGSIAPQLTKKWRGRESIKETARKENTIDKIISTVSYIDDEDFLRSIIPVMKRDMEVIMTYQYKDEEKLSIPILAFGAKEDDVVLLDELKQWEDQTDNNFSFHELHGDHWFLSRNKEFIVSKIEDSISLIKL